MIDLDGTIYKGGRMIPGAREFVSALQDRGIPFVFLTNNSSFSREHYLEKLKGMGMDVSIGNILSSSTATIRYILKEFPGKTVFPLGTEQFVRELTDAGIRIADSDPDIVLLAYDKTITYRKMNDAYHFIMNGAKLIATHPDDLCPAEDGYDMDIGPFIRLFEQMTGTDAIVIGKPNRMMAEMAALEMDADMECTVMVGDRLYTDIRMAEDAGIRSILVLSGETKADDLTDSDTVPTMVVENVGDIVTELE